MILDDQLLDINDKYIFQNNPIKLANRTRYWIGTNIKFTNVAAGQIFQFVIIVCFIFFWVCYHPNFALFIEKSFTQFANTKKPDKNIGAKAS